MSSVPRYVLVLDEHGSVAAASVKALQARGYEILRISDGGAALWMLSRRAIDLLVVDVTAPGARELMAEKAKVPTLAAIPTLIVTVAAEELRARGHQNVIEPPAETGW